jgi:hypothetical protein
VFYPPYDIERDYGVMLSHARHDQPSRAEGECLACHAEPPDPGAAPPKRKGAAHARCAPCHLKPSSDVVPGMEACTACHRAAFGPATTPHRVPGEFPVAATFSHRKHMAYEAAAPAAREGAKRKGDSCRPCHVAVTKAEGEAIPSPSTAECERCHDGKSAFSALAPECRKCHRRPAEQVTRPPRPEERPRFSHRAHSKAGLQATCAACHTLDASGLPRPASADHQPCSDAECHRAEFSSLEPKICSSCHAGTEPWRPLHTERRPRPETEFGARFSHRQHLGGEQPLLQVACASCHLVESGHRDMRLPRDHSSCTGSGCHGQGDAPAPSLAQCEGCHVPGLIQTKQRECVKKQWSVRRRYRHAPHSAELTTEGTPLACTHCHDTVIESTALGDIDTPKKAMCAPCHDGARAFKLTGHGCARCHGK